MNIKWQSKISDIDNTVKVSQGNTFKRTTF